MNNRKQIRAWTMYDWANSAFATSVMAGFFPVFFKQYWSKGVDINKSTLMLGLANSLASLIVAASAPFLGIIADQKSGKKKFLIFFTYLGVLMTANLFLLNSGEWALALIFYALGVIGFSGSIIFYDALLLTVAGADKVDYVSGLGYALGYLGGGLLFTLNVLMTQKPALFGLNNAAEAVRYSFLTVAVWWGIFTIPLILWVKEEKKETVSSENSLLSGFRELVRTIKKLKQLRITFLFLAAYWLYIDGVDTIIRMAVDFGLSIGFQASDLILALLITQFVGFPCAIIFGKLGEKWDVKKLLFICIAVYVFVTIYGMLMTRKYEFFILAVIIGLVQGGIQALSRSFYSRLIPAGHEAEFFGFYNMLGKFATITGPVLVGATGMFVRTSGYSQNIASRMGIFSLVILFIMGAALLNKVDETQGKQDAQNFEN